LQFRLQAIEKDLEDIKANALMMEGDHLVQVVEGIKKL